MGVRPRATSEHDLAGLLARCRNDELTYAPIGISIDDSVPTTLKRHHWSTPLVGANSFSRASEALRTWSMHRRAGLRIAADGAIEVGTNVAFSAPLPIGFVEGTCRIVAVIDEPSRFGFAYGTLPIHPERGEESFIVSRDEHGHTAFDVVGVSRPAHPVARALPMVGSRLQDRAVNRYLAAMRTLAND